ncbi:Protein kinase-like domain protein, partial [Metarhizium majus ARSEF 297]
MTDNDSDFYKTLFEQEKKRREEAEEQRRGAEEQQRRAEEQQRRAEEQQRRAEDNTRRERDRNRPTTFLELLYESHKLLSLPLKAEHASLSTTGSIPIPKGKYCPMRMKPWADCTALHQQIYDSVYRYLQPANGPVPRLFSARIQLEGWSQRLTSDAISGEQALEMYERLAVDSFAGDIIAELCKIPAACEEFRLGEGVRFDNHKNSLEKTYFPADTENAASHIHRPKPDGFCINMVDDTTKALLTSGEYKPPHKLPTRIIRLGLRPMDLWDEMVRSKTTPTDKTEKLRYQAERLVCSAIVQQYHVMIQEGLEVSFLTNGFCDIHLWIPQNDPSTLHYYLYDPNREVDPEDCILLEPKTAIARRLCLYLLSCRCLIRNQEWRVAARAKLRTWQTSFDLVRSQIPKAERDSLALYSDSSDSDHESPNHESPNPQNPDHQNPDNESPNSQSSYQQSPTPSAESPTAEGRRAPTRANPCRESQEAQQRRAESPDSSGSDTGSTVAQRKRGHIQVSNSTQLTSRSRSFQGDGVSPGQHDAEFCTLQCLLGLQCQGVLDEKCPNIRLHQQDRNNKTHPVTAEQLLCSLKEQLNQNLDQNCTPFGCTGRSGAPFKLTCATFGYTVVGKGTTTDWWPEVSREADAYRLLQKAQASAVPVFLGTMDLVNAYFLHGAGEIRHMLVMGWGGESPGEIGAKSELSRELKRSEREVRQLGVIHGDLQRENILWNSEVRRILIIDFHQSKLVPRRKVQKIRRTKRRSEGSTDNIETRQLKRLQVL